MSNTLYRDKMDRKIQLAHEAGIKLIGLQPEDLPRLDTALNSFLPVSDG